MKMYNPYIEGWINYYGQFYRTHWRPTLKRIDVYVIRWARRKFKRLRHKTKGAGDWSSGFAVQIRLYSLTGSYVMATAEHREPYESRGSRTVMGARGGEIPPRNSTIRPKRLPCALSPVYPQTADIGRRSCQVSSVPAADYKQQRKPYSITSSASASKFGGIS